MLPEGFDECTCDWLMKSCGSPACDLHVPATKKKTMAAIFASLHSDAIA